MFEDNFNLADRKYGYLTFLGKPVRRPTGWNFGFDYESIMCRAACERNWRTETQKCGDMWLYINDAITDLFCCRKRDNACKTPGWLGSEDSGAPGSPGYPSTEVDDHIELMRDCLEKGSVDYYNCKVQKFNDQRRGVSNNTDCDRVWRDRVLGCINMFGLKPFSGPPRITNNCATQIIEFVYNQQMLCYRRALNKHTACMFRCNNPNSEPIQIPESQQ